jgi:hypothetical protein
MRPKEIVDHQAEPRYRELAPWERVVAISAGAGIGGMGFAAMFVTNNEGGVVAAILLAGLLLLLGVQGTPLTRFGFRDTTIDLMRRQVERREEVADRVEAENNPDVAAGMLEALKVADPGARRSPVITRAEARVYDQRVFQALSKKAVEAGFALIDHAEVDALLESGGLNLAVEVKYAHHQPITAEIVFQSIEMARRARATGLLVVSNSSISPTVSGAIKDATIPVELVSWESERDDSSLLKAILRLRERATR